MDSRLLDMLESLLLNVRVINGELSRLQRNELLHSSCAETQQLSSHLREAYQRGLDILQQVEKNAKP